MKPVKVIFAGGGTGGHLFPALAIAEKLKQVRKSAEIIFIGTKKGIEGKIIPDSDFKFLPIRISGISRESNLFLTILKNLLVPLEFLFAMLKSFWLLRRYKPDAVVGTGGFVSGPPVFAATLMGIPTLIHEQNSYPGLTTRLLAGRVTQVQLGSEMCLNYLKKKDMKVEISGNPVRGELLRRAESLTSKSYGLVSGKQTILIFGGSQGSHPINMHILKNFDQYATRREIQLLWQTGTLDHQLIINSVGERENVKILPFLTDMAGAYSSADLAICRAGALTLAELASVGLPSLLIPLPHAAEHHQDYNAKIMEAAGAAKIIGQDELASGLLEETVFELLFDQWKLQEMSKAAKSLAIKDSAMKIVNSLLGMLETDKN